MLCFIVAKIYIVMGLVLSFHKPLIGQCVAKTIVFKGLHYDLLLFM